MVRWKEKRPSVGRKDLHREDMPAGKRCWKLKQIKRTAGLKRSWGGGKKLKKTRKGSGIVFKGSRRGVAKKKTGGTPSM